MTEHTGWTETLVIAPPSTESVARNNLSVAAYFIRHARNSDDPERVQDCIREAHAALDRVEAAIRTGGAA